MDDAVVGCRLRHGPFDCGVIVEPSKIARLFGYSFRQQRGEEGLDPSVEEKDTRATHTGYCVAEPARVPHSQGERKKTPTRRDETGRWAVVAGA